MSLGLVLACAKKEKPLTADEIRSYTLTASDVERFVKLYPAIKDVLTQVDRKITLGEVQDPYEAFVGLELPKDVSKAVKEAGYTSDREFIKAAAAVYVAYHHLLKEEGLAQMKAELKKAMKGMSKEEREEAKREIAETEERFKAESNVPESHLRVVKPYKEELDKLFGF